MAIFVELISCLIILNDGMSSRDFHQKDLMDFSEREFIKEKFLLFFSISIDEMCVIIASTR
jgi:hypothetical protein